MPDFIIVSGDTEPRFKDQLEYSNGEKVNLEGAAVQFIMRSATSPEPVKLTGATTVLPGKSLGLRRKQIVS